MSTALANLYGVVSPTGQSEGFCVPVFIDPWRSNHLLVQIVNDRNNIEAFEPFFSSEAIRTIETNVTRKIGDPAFWYFELTNGPLWGGASDIRSQFDRRRTELADKPFLSLQLITACKAEGENAAARAVHRSLINCAGLAGADAWLDTNVLSPRIRGWLNESRRTRRNADFEILALKCCRLHTIM